jgi:hypothetical protein
MGHVPCGQIRILGTQGGRNTRRKTHKEEDTQEARNTRRMMYEEEARQPGAYTRRKKHGRERHKKEETPNASDRTNLQ